MLQMTVYFKQESKIWGDGNLMYLRTAIVYTIFFIQGTYNIPVLREEPNRKQHNACSILKFVLLNVLNFTKTLTRLAVAEADTLHYIQSFFFIFYSTGHTRLLHNKLCIQNYSHCTLVFDRRLSRQALLCFNVSGSVLSYLPY